MNNKINYGFCIERGEKCGYCGGAPCDFESLNKKTYKNCFEYTTDVKRILRNIKEIEILEQIALQVFNGTGEELELILDTCYYGRNRESSIEHLKYLVSVDYTKRKILEK